MTEQTACSLAGSIAVVGGVYRRTFGLTIAFAV